MNISEKLFNVQLSLEKQKRGGFVGSGPSKPPFAPMRGVGEGEKIYKLYEPIRPDEAVGYFMRHLSQKIFGFALNRHMRREFVLRRSNMNILARFRGVRHHENPALIRSAFPDKGQSARRYCRFRSPTARSNRFAAR